MKADGLVALDLFLLLWTYSFAIFALWNITRYLAQDDYGAVAFHIVALCIQSTVFAATFRRLVKSDERAAARG